MKLRTGRILATLAGALVSLTVALHPSPASALCADPTGCICSPLGIESALIVTVSAVGEAEVEAAVSTVFTRAGETSSFEEGDAVTLPADSVPDGPPVVGEDLLVTNEDLGSGETQLRVLSRIGADGRMTCRYDPDYRPDAADAAQLALSDSCVADVGEDMGPVECNDTVPFGCSTPGGAGDGRGAGLALGAVGLALAAAARRRRRS